MINFLRANVDVFTWKPYDMHGLDAELICHNLYINKKFKPIKQKVMRATTKKDMAVKKEVQKLLKVGANRETLFP